MTEAPAAIAAFIATAKELKGLYEKAGDINTAKLILRMEEQLLDAREAVQNLRDENISLKEEMGRLKEVKDMNLAFRDGAYFAADGMEPFCPTCYLNGRFLSLMIRRLHDFEHFCQKCKKGR